MNKQRLQLYIKRAERPGVARGNFFFKNIYFFKMEENFEFFKPLTPLSVHKKFSSIGPAVWPAICNIYLQMSCFII